MATKAHLFISCPLCIGKYTTTSIKIHWPQCLVKWEREQTTGVSPKKQKAPCLSADIQSLLTQFPNLDISSTRIEEWNAESQRIYEVVSLQECMYCKRKFLPDRLIVHLRSCAGQHGITDVGFAGAKQVTVGLEENMSAKASAAKTANNRQTMTTLNAQTYAAPFSKDTSPTCSICHRKFGKTSFPIHLKQCAKKNGVGQGDVDLIMHNFMNPVSICKSKKEMTKEDKVKLIEFVDKKMAQVNLDAYDLFMDGRVSCEGCGRKFAQNRIDKHINICKGK